ncbi:MAG: class I SAM-dependent methyltransferase [Acidimicrobiia bacterium]|nr:cyclopropane-fatty-acyl-phospholipid synthase family protein [Acidimicrobiia bacterium]MBT8217178.1 cyclopropane-fatty-acyl-phospholipid synthase family protein [Acidimicrobiia bacterium]NNF10099.1 class I SAM-dependent methyltransferase [Acidimicrobiia bacterium]NNL68613.1 class I SAM-dependent methyltransferase [Acidimicrobiia bacterium]
MSDALEVSRRVYDLLIKQAPSGIAVRTWTGETWGPEGAAATLVLRHPGALRALLLPPSDLTAGEAYVFDDVDVEGDMLAMVRWVTGLGASVAPSLQALRLLRLLLKLPRQSRRSLASRPNLRGRRHSLHRDRTAVSHHYDTGNGFFEAVLGPSMVYSCAAFLDPGEPLEVAQRRKLDLICRKLQLRGDQHLLDIGCGWGSLAVHAAREYGVRVMGITLSERQAEWATDHAKRVGVDDLVEFRVQDYREVVGKYDAISSIGMFEHVGAGQLDHYFGEVQALLRPDGVFLNHGITVRRATPMLRRKTFVYTHVFPDGELLPIDGVVRSAEQAGFELRDAESLRTSYGQTLRRWVANLESEAADAKAATTEQTYRKWRAYMAGSALAFESGELSVFQLVLRPSGRPWTYGRSHLLAADDVERP